MIPRFSRPIPRYPVLSRSYPFVTWNVLLYSDFACLNPAQRAAVKILTKYVLRSVKDALGEERCR